MIRVGGDPPGAENRVVRGGGFYTDVEFRFDFLHVKLGSKNIFNIFDLFQEYFSLI